MTDTPPYRRILLKVSGEVLMGDASFGINIKTLNEVADDIVEVVQTGVQLCLVIGAGNIFRGLSLASQGMDRSSADYMGMLGTVINALAVQSALEARGIHTRVQSAIPMDAVCEPYIRRRAIRHLEKGRVVIFAAGTGHPYFTTDTAAALRAAEVGCDALFKGTSVDGVYSADPKKSADARRYDRLTYQDFLSQDLRVMDASAITMMRDSQVPVVVFSIRDPGNMLKVIKGQGVYTTIAQS